MQNPVISIIMPAHKSAGTIARALESVLVQDFPLPFELIVSFDDRGDGTKEILEDYASKHPDIVKIHNKINKTGAAGSRMEGIMASKGEFIYFMDSDDELQPFCLSTLYKAQQKHNADCVNASFATISNGRVTHNVFAREHVYNHKEWINTFFHDTCFRAFLWTKLIRRSIVIQFPLLLLETYQDMFEDIAFAFSILTKCEKIVSIKDEVYLYHKDNPTSSTSAPRKDRALYHIAVFACIKRFIEVYGSDEDDVDYFHHVSRCFWSIKFDLSLDRKNGAGRNYAKQVKSEFKTITRKAPLELEGHFYSDILKRAIREH